MPIITAAGIVYPGRSTNDTQSAVTPAGGGSNVAGKGGSVAPCSYFGISWSDSVAGSNAVGPAGGTGGDASSLGPMGTCTPGVNCEDAGAGGGGGGGYFGGGGGATGPDKASGGCGGCNDANSGQGGAAGSSFVSKLMADPIDVSSSLVSTGSGSPGNGTVVFVPAIEIDAPTNGAVYTPGQVVHASWACGFDPVTGLGMAGGPSCKGTVANGSPINTSPGTHTFTVSGTAYSNGYQPVNATITYRVGKPGSGGGSTNTARAAIAGFNFKLSVPKACVARGGKLHVTLSKSGSGKGYKLAGLRYYVGGGKAHRAAHTGSVSLPVGKLAAGTHKLTLAITLVSAKRHGKPKTTKLAVPFSIC